MIPQGIFLVESSPEQIAATHDSWCADIESLGPWSVCDNADFSGQTCKRAQCESASTLVVFPACHTTMELARSMAEDSLLGEWGAVLSVVQDGGRGQLRRPWVSLPGNVHASIVLPKPPSVGPWRDILPQILPLVVGSLFADVLQSLGASIQLKWPNDILQNGRKVGGMLIEERAGITILGLGLNLAGCPDDRQMRDDCSAPAGTLAFSTFSGGPLVLLETLVSRGKNVYAVMLDEIPPAQCLRMIENRLAWMGKTVLVHEGNQDSYEAVITGLSPQGGLVVVRGGEEIVLYSGSIFPL
ncbi:biotin--[acetyl-CoA-carboxylase] ligase [Pseudodesulfovibrio sp. JC047]|uniref:biotin--[acetyl-CoA-carboxylase] ligase n=1 Tax=Pseudodesulfovibrio sp. JC047 TaxID=2683199 RepID=UPI0013D254EB|nr:biotin--[acetyl-CoA-carboxylase] ligase [Pseudodesulfovibrio sp. JC047]NDV19093.1 biotin--[acetyl-CoA-carboxylase] ligase [Pseudodesulfovibrio sp. JC047]